MVTPRRPRVGAGRKPKLLLSAGHHGGDPGGLGVDGMKEWGLNQRIAWEMCWRLDKSPVEVELVPQVTLARKVEWVNTRTGALRMDGYEPWAVEIHCNVSERVEVNGVESIHFPRNPIGREVGEILCVAVATGQRWPNRGSKTPTEVGRGKLAWVESTIPTAVILEYGFITSPVMWQELERNWKGKMDALGEGFVRAEIAVRAQLDPAPRCG